MPNIWQYETLIVKRQSDAPSPFNVDDIRENLNRLGERGYRSTHALTDQNGDLIFVLSKDTGRLVDDGEDTAKSWLVDVHEASGLGK